MDGDDIIIIIIKNGRCNIDIFKLDAARTYLININNGNISMAFTKVYQ